MSKKCKFCNYPIEDHPDKKPCSDDNEILGRYIEVVNEYASTCDGCGEITLHELLEMDEKTQLGYCKNCLPKL